MVYIYVKMVVGCQEIEDCVWCLLLLLWFILLMVDGQCDDDVLIVVLLGLCVFDDVLVQFVGMGLIEIVGGVVVLFVVCMFIVGCEQDLDLYKCLYDWMSELVCRYFGFKGYFMQFKIECCIDVGVLEKLWLDMVVVVVKVRSLVLVNCWLSDIYVLFDVFDVLMLLLQDMVVVVLG